MVVISTVWPVQPSCLLEMQTLLSDIRRTHQDVWHAWMLRGTSANLLWVHRLVRCMGPSFARRILDTLPQAVLVDLEVGVDHGATWGLCDVLLGGVAWEACIWVWHDAAIFILVACERSSRTVIDSFYRSAEDLRSIDLNGGMHANVLALLGIVHVEEHLTVRFVALRRAFAEIM